MSTLTATLPPEKLKHVKFEDKAYHAEQKAFTELKNKTKDPEHVFTVTEPIDDFHVYVWAQHTDSTLGKSVFSRVYMCPHLCEPTD
jgi:hypothetical protein